VLVTIREQLQSTISFDIGDSALDTRKQTWKDLFARMERLAVLEEPWTLVIRCHIDSVSSTLHQRRRRSLHLQHPTFFCLFRLRVTEPVSPLQRQHIIEGACCWHGPHTDADARTEPRVAGISTGLASMLAL